MKDLIDRQAAIDALRKEMPGGCSGKAEYIIEQLPTAQQEQPSEIQDILNYLDTVLHPIISPEHWNVYSELHDMISTLPTAQPAQKTFSVIDNKTGKEADPYEIALNEDWAKNLMYCDMEGFAILEDGSLILVDECGRHEYCPIERFEVRWDEG